MEETMKKFLSMLLAVAMVATLAISASALGDAGLYTYDESDGEYWSPALAMYDKTTQGIWFEDGSVAGHNIAQLADGTFIEENAMANLKSGWYEVVLCNLGTNPEWFPAEVEGKLALCVRGDSTFTVKSENALNAGAIGMLMGNNCRAVELVDENGVMTGEYENITMNLDYATLPMGSVSSDVTARLVAACADISIADAVVAVENVYFGDLELSVSHKKGAWVFLGTEAEYKANTTRTDANTITGAGAAAATTETAAPAAAEGEPVLTIDFAEGAGNVELVNAEIVKDSERGNVLKVNGVGTSQTGASYGLLKTDVFEKTNWENGMSINMWIKTDASSTLHGTAPIFSLDIANVGYIALTTSLESAINTDGNDTSLGISPRIWTDPINVGGGVNLTEEEEWQFISVVYNEDHIDLYVDGELYSDHPFANGNATDMSAMINLMIESEFVYSVRLGSWLCSWWKYGDYEGCIDDFTVYNKILSADEVKALYNATKDVEVPAEPVVEETPVVEEEPAVEEAPVVEEEPAVEETPVVEEVVEETVEEVVEEAPVVEETVEEAPQTFDFGVIAAVAALVSAAGYALSKKR